MSFKIQELRQPWTPEVGLYIDISQELMVSLGSRVQVERLRDSVYDDIKREYLSRQWHILDWHENYHPSHDFMTRTYRIMAICTPWSCDPEWGYDH